MSTAASTAPPPAPAPAVTYDPLSEKRFAVVIYGGVSLAIYINGIVQEMLAMVRATSPATTRPGETRPLLDGPLTGTEKVYRKLGQLLGPDGTSDLAATWPLVQRGDALPIRTRFVIDVLSGTSAGGINAMFLAKALAANAPLRKLQTLWQEEGDIAKLINDKRSLEGSLRRQDPPQSLLNSHRMYKKLLDALDGMDVDAAKGGASPLVDALDLFSTTTDIAGLVLPITLADRVVNERRHRNVFHFQYAAKGPAQKNDFGSEINPFLAYAARCTSAFPFAFEPMALCDIFPVLRASEVHSARPYCTPDTTRWQDFYVDYIGDPRMATRSQPFQLRPFGDGGYLDNKPFSYAIETLLTRHADLPVERKLVYIEPSPDRLRADTFEDARPDAIENSLAALLTLPRYETIRQDLEVVVQRNVEVERINRVVDEVVGSIRAGESGQNADAWINNGSSQWGTGYVTYEKLKISTVTDDLADLLAHEFAIDAHSALGEGVRVIAQVWRDVTYPADKSTRQFLLTYDVSYRLRRFRHVWRHINRLHRDASGDAAFVAAYRAELRTIKSKLEEPYLSLKDLLERAGLPKDLTSGVLLKESEMMLVVEPPPDEELANWPGLEQRAGFRDATDRGKKVRARFVLDLPWVLNPGQPSEQVVTRNEPLTFLATALANRFKARLIAASAAVKGAVAADGDPATAVNRARADVDAAYKAFERYDSAIFPITYGSNVGECERIDVHRISPDDATATAARFGSLARIRGQALGAFGAFLDADWRKNDILMGRFHGAERIISMLLPGRDEATAAMRRALIAEAHEAIACDFLPIASARRAEWEEETKAFLRSVRDQPNPELMASSATRASAVTGAMLEGISDARHAPGKEAFGYLALVSRFLFQFVEVSVPHTLGALFGKYWLQLFLLFAVMLDVIAVFQQGVREVAVIASVAVVVLFWARQWLRRYLRGQLLVSPAGAMGMTAVMVLAVTAAAFWLPALWPALAHAFERVVEYLAAQWDALGTESSIYTPKRFANAFLGSAIAVSLFSLLILRGVMKAIRTGAGLPKHPVRRMQSAKTRGDVVAAVGRYDLDTQKGVEKAMRADFGFAASYALLFTAIGVWQAVHGQPLALIVSALGIAAAIADALENRAVLAALAPSTQPDDAVLSPQPARFSTIKWVLVAAAIAASLWFMFT